MSLDETLELTIVHASTRVLLDNMTKGAAREQAEIFRSFVERLARAGADVAAVTSLSGPFCIRELEELATYPECAASVAPSFRATGHRARRSAGKTHGQPAGDLVLRGIPRAEDHRKNLHWITDKFEHPSLL